MSIAQLLQSTQDTFELTQCITTIRIEIEKGDTISIGDSLFYLFKGEDIIVNPLENKTIKELKTSEFRLRSQDDFTQMIKSFYNIYKSIKSIYPNKKLRYFSEGKIKTARVHLSDNRKLSEDKKLRIPNYIYRDEKNYVVLPGWKEKNFLGIKDFSEKDDIIEVDGILIDKKVVNDREIMIPLLKIFNLEKDNVNLKSGKITKEALELTTEQKACLLMIKTRLLDEKRK